MVSVTSASRYITSAARYITSAARYHPRYQSRSSMYIRGQIPRNFAESAQVVPIAYHPQEIIFGLNGAFIFKMDRVRSPSPFIEYEFNFLPTGKFCMFFFCLLQILFSGIPSECQTV